MDRLKIDTELRSRWFVSTYESDGDLIKEEEKADIRWYYPFELFRGQGDQPIYIEFANLSDGNKLASPDAILAFINKYGLLEETTDSMADIQIEQKVFNFVVTTCAYLRENRKITRRKKITELMVSVGPLLINKVFYWDRVKELVLEQYSLADTGHDLDIDRFNESWQRFTKMLQTGIPRDLNNSDSAKAEILSYVLADEVMRKAIVGIEFGIAPLPGELKPYIFFKSLASTLYMMAWLDLNDDLISVRKCALDGCHRTFRTTNTKKIYHDRSCSTIAAKAALRRRKKEKKE